ncbi:MAG: GAF domain-containing protein, partial [Chloroflexota bacterium]
MAKEPSMRDPAEELAALKIQVGQVGDSLRRQDDALRTRGMKLPTEAITEFSALIKDISAIESVIGGNVIELGQLRALTATGAMINSTLDVDDVLARAMDQVIVLAGAERGFIILSNEQTGDLEFRISRDSTGKGSTSGDGPQLSMNIVNEVIETGKPMLTDNAYKDPRIQDHMSVAQFVLRSVVCVPLTQRDRRIGAVYVDNRLRAGVFTDRE